jgi:hypothetical protein
MGFVVPPLEFHLGLPRWQHWTLQIDELDVVLYSLEKAVRLLLKSNPNIVGLLWLRESEHVHQHPAFSELRARRDIFSSQAAAEALLATRPTSSSEWRPSTSIEWARAALTCSGASRPASSRQGAGRPRAAPVRSKSKGSPSRPAGGSSSTGDSYPRLRAARISTALGRNPTLVDTRVGANERGWFQWI